MCLYTEESLCSLLRLNSTYRQLVKDNENLQLDHKNIKSQLNSAKLDQTKLEAEFSKLKEQYQQLDITSTKLTNQCEVRRRTLYLGDPRYVFVSKPAVFLMCHICRDDF